MIERIGEEQMITVKLFK